MQPSDQPSPRPWSFHLPLLSPLPPSSFFRAVSIPTCKGHPGNREAAVDREINKQKKRERSDGGQSLVIHRVNYRPTSHKHTPKAAGSVGSEASALFCRLCMYASITCFRCFVFILSLHPPSSLCSLLPLCSFSVLLLSSCSPPPPSTPLWGLKAHRAVGC